MGLLSLILLIVLGVLGISAWLKTQYPAAGGKLGPLEQVEGWIGLVGLVWGVILLLRWLSALNVMQYAPGAFLLGLLIALVILALSLLLGLPVLRSLFGENGFTNKAAQLAERVRPYKIGLGFACLVLALYSLIGQAF